MVMVTNQALLEGKAGSDDPGILEISSSCQACRGVCLCGRSHGFFSRRSLRVTWMRALCSEVVLGLSLREWREQENVPPLISVTDV